MEIRVSCNNLIILNNFYKINLINLSILSYELKKDTLNGDVKVNGMYLTSDENEKGFEDIIPFTVVFRNDKIKINNVFIENELFKLIENKGVDTKFDLVVEYDIVEEQQCDNEEDVIEVPVELDTTVEAMPVFDDLIVEATQITEEFDKMLEEVLDLRNDEHQIDNVNTEVNLNNNYKEDNILFKNQLTTYNTINVYYLSKENEIEKIAREKRISINDLYKTNDDFSKTLRLIINE